MAAAEAEAEAAEGGGPRDGDVEACDAAAAAAKFPEEEWLRSAARAIAQPEAGGGAQVAQQLLVLTMVGKCGTGKTSVANTLLGERRFEARRSAASVTQQCQLALLPPWPSLGAEAEAQAGAGVAAARPTLLVDSPGLGDPSLQQDTLCDALRRLMHGVDSCLASEGLTPRFAILLVFGVHNRITKEDLEIVRILHEVFGKRYLSNTVVVWTHGDMLGDDGLQAYLAELPDESVQSFLASCRNVVVDNLQPFGCGSHRSQVAEVLDTAWGAAGDLPRLKGKAARRARQAEMRRAEPAAAGGGPMCSLL